MDAEPDRDTHDAADELAGALGFPDAAAVVSRAERLGLGDAYPVKRTDAEPDIVTRLLARAQRYAHLEPDGFTGAECDVDALAAARAADRGDISRPVHRTRTARGDRDE